MADDASLIREIKERGSESCLKELIARHSGIYLQMVNQTISPQSNVCKGDIVDDKDFFIYQKALTFDPTRNIKFSTYLGNEIKWKCLNLHNKSSRYDYCDIADQAENLVEPDYSQQLEDKETIAIIFERAENHPDERVRNIIRIRYKECERNKLTPWKNIAAQLKLSIQGCINIHKRFIKELQLELVPSHHYD